MKIFKNFLYNVVYQILNILIPLITAPYTARVLGAEGIGTYAYYYAIISYFMLFANLGILNYGNRSIATIRDEKEKMSKVFSEIYTMQIGCNLIVISIYIILSICMKESIYLLTMLPFLLSCIFDVTWFFYGIEEFKLVTSYAIFCKVLNVIGLFLFVKKTDDLIKYFLIMSLSILVNQILLFAKLKHKVDFKIPDIHHVLGHVKPNLILFIPVIAISLYRYMDKIMLGKMSDYTQVGYYENAEKITNIPFGVIAALGIVMMPQITNMIKNDKGNEGKKLTNYSMMLALFMGMGLTFGIFSIADEFIPLFYGKGFEECINVLNTLAFTIPFLTWANVIRTQYLIPYAWDKVYIQSVILGAIINLIINYLLIPLYEANGAAVATVCAEATVCIYQTVFVRNVLPITKYFKSAIYFTIAGLFMYVSLNFISLERVNDSVQLFAKIGIGMIVYMIFGGILVFYLKKCKRDIL